MKRWGSLGSASTCRGRKISRKNERVAATKAEFEKNRFFRMLLRFLRLPNHHLTTLTLGSASAPPTTAKPGLFDFPWLNHRASSRVSRAPRSPKKPGENAPVALEVAGRPYSRYSPRAARALSRRILSPQLPRHARQSGPGPPCRFAGVYERRAAGREQATSGIRWPSRKVVWQPENSPSRAAIRLLGDQPATHCRRVGSAEPVPIRHGVLGQEPALRELRHQGSAIG